jgi:hypothetical protein
MKQRPLDLEVNDPEMIEARRRLADEAAAQQEAEAHFKHRIAEARAAVAPKQAIGFMFVPNSKTGRFKAVAITDENENEERKL